MQYEDPLSKDRKSKYPLSLQAQPTVDDFASQGGKVSVAVEASMVAG